METLQTVILTVLVFFVIVSIHEWGHYFFAKRAGILVREFAIGFGPKLFSFKRGETKFTIRLIPAGGFVRMAGEDPEIIEIKEGQTIAVSTENDLITQIFLDKLDERTQAIRGEVIAIDLEKELFIELDIEGIAEKFTVHPQAMMVGRGTETQIAPLDRHFTSKSPGKRAMAIFAGPLMNFVLAFILFIVYVQFAGIRDNVQVGSLVAGQPAEAAELQVGDIIYAVNGQTIGTDRDKMIAIIAENPNKRVSLEVIRNDVKQELEVIPIPNELGEGKIGVLAGYGMRSASFGESLTGGVTLMKDMTILIFDGLKMLVTLQFDFDDLGGPVRTAEITSEIARQGILQLTSWTATLSLYLGIFNLLPIPALDGSRLMFIGYEVVRRKPVSPNKESLIHFIGFALLMLLMLVVTYNDIMRLIRGE